MELKRDSNSNSCLPTALALRCTTTGTWKAYEFLLERIQHYMREYHPKHRALIVMDDTSRQLNRAVAMKHASFQRVGNRNVKFPAVVEYPFFTRSELSNGVQRLPCVHV